MTDSPLIRPGHLFSQHSLATFVRCPRRFLLKYIDRQPWPMPENQEPEAYEAQLARGRVFHQWMVRRVRGVPMDGIAAACEDAEFGAEDGHGLRVRQQGGEEKQARGGEAAHHPRWAMPGRKTLFS